jgi:hypothetical protein
VQKGSRSAAQKGRSRSAQKASPRKISHFRILSILALWPNQAGDIPQTSIWRIIEKLRPLQRFANLVFDMLFQGRFFRLWILDPDGPLLPCSGNITSRAVRI